MSTSVGEREYQPLLVTASRYRSCFMNVCIQFAVRKRVRLVFLKD